MKNILKTIDLKKKMFYLIFAIKCRSSITKQGFHSKYVNRFVFLKKSSSCYPQDEGKEIGQDLLIFTS